MEIILFFLWTYTNFFALRSYARMCLLIIGIVLTQNHLGKEFVNLQKKFYMYPDCVLMKHSDRPKSTLE